jgi:hypothetical protein
MPGLEWHRAIELPGGVWVAGNPAGTRRAWIHRAPEDQVVELYRAASQADRGLAAPWWLRALAEETLSSRKGGFAVEDAVAALLSDRPGWVYVPWVGFGEDGYWEFVPSERTAQTGGQIAPTTVQLTHRHTGWIDMIPPHSAAPPDPVPIEGARGLAARLPEVEAL